MQFKGLQFKTLELEIEDNNGNIGFSCIPDYIRQISIKEGFQINIMVIGRRGLGTSTLINSIFAVPIIDKNRNNQINVFKNEIIENGIKLNTVVVTYHGEDQKCIIEYLDKKNIEYFENERGYEPNFNDERVYACIYLVPLDEIRSEELEMIKTISKKCNFIPIIPKSDTFTGEELENFKSNLLEFLSMNDVKIYLPYILEDLDQELSKEAELISEKYPLAVVASEDIYEHKAELIRGRKYKWGFVDVENEEISDLPILKKILIHSFLDDLIYQNEIDFYQSFRQECFKNKDFMNNLEMKIVEKLKKESLSECYQKKSDSSNKNKSLKKDFESMTSDYKDLKI